MQFCSGRANHAKACDLHPPAGAGRRLVAGNRLSAFTPVGHLADAQYLFCSQGLDQKGPATGSLLMRQLSKPGGLCQNFVMTQPSLHIAHEERKIEQLLIVLAKKQPVSAKPAPIAYGKSATGTAHPRVFFST